MSLKERISAFIVDNRRVVLTVMLILTAIWALMIPQVTVNSDMTKYLADSSPMKQGIDVMAQEFPDMQTPKTVRLMVDDLTEDLKPELKSRLEKIEGVDSVTWEAGSDDYNRDNHTLYVMSTGCNYGSAAEKAIEANSLKTAQSSEFNVTLAQVSNNSSQPVDLPIIVLIMGVGFLTIVLCIMCRSWMEPVIYLIAIGCAVGLNMGTNIIQGSIAQVTFSIGAILQLVLSMDYSVILMNRFRQELTSELTAYNGHDGVETPAFSGFLDLLASDLAVARELRIKAMKRALAGALTAIAASSLTTFVGLLTLVFMTFKIGGDLGVVLAKGVLFSLICVFTVLPALILMSHKALARSVKPSPSPRLNKLAHVEYKIRYVLPVCFVGIFIAAFILQSSTPVSYTLHYADPIADVFPTNSQVVVLYNNKDEDAVELVANELLLDANVKEVNAWATTLGKPLTASELADAVQQMDMPEIEDTGFDEKTLKQLYTLYASKYPPEEGDESQETAISIAELARYLNEDILTNFLYSRMISADQKATIASMQDLLDDARSQLVGPNYSLMSITVNTAAGTQEAADLMEHLATLCEENFEGNYYLIGDAAMVREMRQGFAHEMLQITLISAIAIFLVVAIAFRNIVIPFLLVLVVQCGVYLTIVAVGLQGYDIYYLAMLIVQCILMGATIDYGILLTNQYREARMSMDIPQALATAYNNSINTIMTSGLIMIVVTAALAVMSPEPTIAEICQTISMGATSAVILILFILPGIIAALDRFVAGKR
ncbi:MAG: MMPL family transporter [Coriobacteriales bacterium]|nr:MMPL family transporter [Coriobacteriales bacterium]